MAILLNNEIINPLIEAINTGEYEYGAAISEDVEVFFNDPESAFSHLVSIKKGDNLVRFALNDADPSECVVSGDSIIYPEAFTDTDIYYTVSSGELKEDIMLLSPEAPRTFIFTLESEGVTAQLQEDRSIDYIDSTTGELVWSIQAPYALDANNNNVPVELVFGEGLYSLTVATDESTAYPVSLDPTVTLGNASYNSAQGRQPLVQDFNGRWYAAYTVSNTELAVYTSADLLTWTRLTGFEVGMTGSRQQYASLAADTKGNVHMVWDGRNSGVYCNRLKYARYNGTSWTPFRNIGSLPVDVVEERPTICVDGNDVIHVVFTAGGVGAPYPKTFKYIKSADGGATWTPYITIRPESEGPNWYSIAAGADNTLHLIWEYADSVFYSTFVPENVVWSWPLQLNIGGNAAGPCLVLDSNDRPHVFWHGRNSASYDSSTTAIEHIRHDGTAWTPREYVYPTDGLYQFYPSANVDPQGSIHVAMVGQDVAGDYSYAAEYTRYDGSSWSPWSILDSSSGKTVSKVALPSKYASTMPLLYVGESSGAYIETITSATEGPPAPIEDTADFDLIRRTAVNLPVNTDTKRLITRSDEPAMDTKRGLTLSHSTISDTRRAISVSHTALTDTKRVIGIADNTLTDTRRPVNVSRSALTDTKRPVLVTSSSALDTHRQVQVTASSAYDTLRTIMDAAIQESYDLRRTLIALDSLSMDTARRTNVTSQAAMDTTRRTAVTSSSVMDMKRALTVTASATTDSMRRLLRECETQRDTKRRTQVTSSSSHDTTRILEAFLIAVQLVCDTTRRVATAADANYDSIRRIEAAISAEMDVARRLTVSDTSYNDTLRTLTPFLMALEASFDTSRKLTAEDEALLDTLRRAYGIVDGGTVELTMSFLADAMGVLRLQY